MDAAHLTVEVELNVFDEFHFIGELFQYAGEYFSAVFAVFPPFIEIGSTEFIAESAESGIRFEPLPVFFDKSLEVGAGEGFLSFLCIYLTHISCLGFVDALVVYFFELIEFFCKSFIVCHALLVLDDAEFLNTQVHGMERECAVGVIGVGVGPGACHGGVVDRQDLYDGLSSSRCPVGKLDDVEEVADAEVVIAAEREHRNRRTGAFPQVECVYEPHAGEDCGATSVRSDADGAVAAAFPYHDISCRFVDDEEFILCACRNAAGRDVGFP